jgi:MoxR-like ATPase
MKNRKYILDIIFATRYPEKYKLADLKPLISFGASPRGSINLANAAKCYALSNDGYVIPEDVRAVVHDVLRHRIGLLMKPKPKILLCRYHQQNRKRSRST